MFADSNEYRSSNQTYSEWLSWIMGLEGQLGYHDECVRCICVIVSLVILNRRYRRVSGRRVRLYFSSTFNSGYFCYLVFKTGHF